MQEELLPKFRSALARCGAAGVGKPEFELGRDGKYSLHYVPFEYVNKAAKLVIVGITPGPNQIQLAYAGAQRAIQAGLSDEEVMIASKKQGAFGSDTMRPNLLKMLRHFGFDSILGVNDISSLWGSNAHLLHSTSVVPHAAFVQMRAKGAIKDAPFAGDFDEVLRCSLLRTCYEERFLPALRSINADALYVGLGRCPEQALATAVERGYLRKEQVLGAFSHPSTSGGSSVSYYLREKSIDDLSPKDPVRNRTDWLDAAYAAMQSATDHLRRAA